MGFCAILSPPGATALDFRILCRSKSAEFASLGDPAPSCLCTACDCISKPNPLPPSLPGRGKDLAGDSGISGPADRRGTRGLRQGRGPRTGTSAVARVAKIACNRIIGDPRHLPFWRASARAGAFSIFTSPLVVIAKVNMDIFDFRNSAKSPSRLSRFARARRPPAWVTNAMICVTLSEDYHGNKNSRLLSADRCNNAMGH